MSKKAVQHAGKSVTQAVYGVLFLLCSFVSLALYTPPVQAADAVPAELTQESISLAPYLEVYVDGTGALAIEDIQQPQIQSKFTPFTLGHIYSSENGSESTLWLRFTMAGRDRQNMQQGDYLLDMGSAVAPYTRLYVPGRNLALRTIQWQEYSPSMGGVFLMPDQQNVTITAYVRVQAVPGMWFSPMLRTPHNAATSLELLATPMAIMALGIVMLLCLLRGFTDKGQWRFWAGLYTAMTFLYAVMGIPHTQSLGMGDLASVLAPGMALILLPHVARHVMNTPQKSRTIDVQYMFLSLVGVLVALLPLVPGFSWTIPYIELWPVLTLCFVPTTLAAWMSGFEGSRRFLFSCLLPPLGVALGLLGLLPPVGFAIFPVTTLPALPLWGVALGSLLMAGTASPSHVREKQEKSQDLGIPSVESLVQSDPNLRLVPVEEAQSLEVEQENTAEETPKRAISKLEEQLHWPVEQLNRHMAALEACALPVGARDALASLSQASRDIVSILHTPAKERMAVPTLAGIEETVFDLQSLLRQAHDCVSPVADKKNIALSWFMPPHLSQCYKGDALQLLFVLRLLLESSVRSTHRGAVQLAVRRVPESVNPGHLLFTVTDTGTGKPPQERSVTALARAWELSATYRGFLGVESNASGATISFTVHCEVSTPADREMAHSMPEAVKKMSIILVSDIADDRQMWGFFLEKMAHPDHAETIDGQEKLPEYAILEARTMEEALALYQENMVALMLYDARMPLPNLEQGMRALYDASRKSGKPFPLCMAMYSTDTVEALEPHVENIEDFFGPIGFAHVLPLPVTKQRLYDEVQDLLYNGVAKSPIIPVVSVPLAEEECEQDRAAVVESLEQDLLGPESTAAQQCHEGMHEDLEEIIDTGMPILDLHGTKQEPMASSLPEPLMDTFTPLMPEDLSAQDTEENEKTQDVGMTSLSEAIFLVDEMPMTMSEDEQEEFPSQELTELPEKVLTVQEALENMDSMEHEMVASMEEEITQALAEQEDFSEARDAYSAEEESIIDDLLNAEEALVTQTQAVFTRPAPAEDKSNAAYLTSLLDMGDEAEEPKVSKLPQAAEVEEMVAVLTKDALRPQSMTKPRGTVPYERRETSTLSGGGDWVGEPMPVGSSSASESVKEPMAQPFAAPCEDTVTREVEAATQQLRAAVLQEKNKAQTTQESGQESGQSVVKNTTKSSTSSAYDFGGDWVGEPMPIASQAKEDETLLDSAGEDPLSMTPLGAKAQEELPELTFHRDLEAEQRGREEISYLKKVFTKFPGILSKKEKTSPQPSMPTLRDMDHMDPISEVGEPMPITSKAQAHVDSASKVEEPHAESAVKSATESATEQAKKRAPQSDASEKAHAFEETLNEVGQEPAEELFEELIEEVREESVEEPVVDMSTTQESVSSIESSEKQAVKPRVSSPFAWNVEPEDVVEDVEKALIEEALPKDVLPKDVLAEETPEMVYDMASEAEEQNEEQVQAHLSPIERLVVDLDLWIDHAKTHLATGQVQDVEEVAAAIANSAEEFGLRTLGRLARTVEAAARAQDQGALQDLVPELEMSVQRNKAALSE